jgi:glycosyltransferase involved in cell wall biosynthesis
METPGLQLTVLSLAEAHRAPVPPAGEVPWVVALAGAADRGVPASWVGPLRDRATGVLVAHEDERQACLAAGVSPARLVVVPVAVDPSRWARSGAAYPRAAPTAGTAVLLPATPWSLPRVQQLVALYQRLFVETDPLVLHLHVPPVSPETADPADPAVAAYSAWRERLIAMRAHQRPKMPFIWLDDAVIQADEWPALYRSAHALLSPGIGCGTELLAAQRCGVPVLAVDGGAARRWLSAESGWVIPVEAEGRPQGDALRQALMAACDPARRAERVAAADAAWVRHAVANAAAPGGLSAAWGERVAALWHASGAFTPQQVQ